MDLDSGSKRDDKKSTSKSTAKLYVNHHDEQVKPVESNEVELERLLERQQRPDLLHKLHYQELEALSKFHRGNPDSPRRHGLLDMDMFNDPLFSRESEREMRPDEIGRLLASSAQLDSLLNDADTQMRFEEKEEKEPIRVGVNEKMYMENQYFDKLLKESRHQSRSIMIPFV